MSKDYISPANTAKLVRKVLKATFPGVTFYVTTNTYSMGASIDVRWLDGPTAKEVDAVVKQFEGKSFDGSIDLGCYWDHWLLPDGTVTLAGGTGTAGSMGYIESVDNAKPHPDAVKVSFGADYVMTDRSYTREFLERVAAEFHTKQGGHDEWAPPPIEDQNWYAGRKARPGAAYFADDYRKAPYHSTHYNSTVADEYRRAAYVTSAFEAPEANDGDGDENTAPSGDYEVSYDRDWTWVKFAAKPALEVRDTLKSLGGRWSRRRKAWYIRERVAAETLAGALS